MERGGGARELPGDPTDTMCAWSLAITFRPELIALITRSTDSTTDRSGGRSRRTLPLIYCRQLVHLAGDCEGSVAVSTLTMIGDPIMHDERRGVRGTVMVKLTGRVWRWHHLSGDVGGAIADSIGVTTIRWHRQIVHHWSIT